MFALSGGAEELSSGNSNSTPSTDDSNINYNFHEVPPSGGNLKVFHDAVIGHIVDNKGIQDFYSIPAVETQWLATILASETKWHEQMPKA